MLLGSPHQLRSAVSIDLSVDGVTLELQSKLKNLGVIFDAILSLEPFVGYRTRLRHPFFILETLHIFGLCCPFLLLKD